MTHAEMVAKWMHNPHFKAEYDALEDDFLLLTEMIKARQTTGLTLAQVAEKMDRKFPTVARIEASSNLKQFSPSVKSLREYAKAYNCRIQIKYIPNT